MTDHVHQGCNHSSILQDVARQAMIDRGLAPDFSDAALKQAGGITGAANETDASIRDLRSQSKIFFAPLLYCLTLHLSCCP